LTYSYDPVGNRLSKNGLTYMYNTMNELFSISDGITFSYDGNGNRTGKTTGQDTWEYTYDYANRLTQIKKNSTLLEEYVYDGDGKRIQVTKNNETTTYIYSDWNVLYEENTTGKALYIYGPAGRLAKRTTIQGETCTFYYHNDQLGSTRLVTDQSHNAVTEVSYTPFGESTLRGEESYLYTGKEQDETGLYFYGARYYDPAIGRFITRDPLSGRRNYPQSLNRYTYCVNNPVKFIDPTGLTFSMCNIDTGVCIRVFEDGRDGWAAYDENGKITDSEEIEKLIAGNDAQKAHAAYLMFLVTHPEIEGDPGQEPKDWGKGKNTHFFEYEVTIDGQPVTLIIGVDDRPHDYDKYGNIEYAHMNEVEIGKEYQIVFFQEAFSSVAALFHLAGHEGQHVVDYIRTGKTTEESAWGWNRRNDFVPPFYMAFPFDRSLFPLLYPSEPK
jgi:RHS repeat-associated protein